MKYIVILFLWSIFSFPLLAQDESKLQELYARANERLEEGAYENALISYNQLVNSNFEDRTVYLSRGIAHYHLGEFELAIKDFDQAFRQQLRNARLVGYRGMSKYQLKNYQGAGSDLEQAVMQGFSDPTGIYQLGNIKFQSARYNDAIRYYKRAEELGLNSAALYNNRGKAWMEAGKSDTAIVDFNKAIEIDKNLTVAYKNRSQIHIDRQNWDKALEDLNVICEEGNGEDLLQRAIVLIHLEDYKNAIRDLLRADSKGVENIDPLLATAYFKNKDYDKAAVFFDKVVRADAGNPEAWEKLGVSLYLDNQFSQARIALEKAIEKGQSTTESIGYRGLSYYKLNEFGKAFEDLSRVSTMGFTNEDAYYFLGQLLIDKEKYEPAIVQLNKGLALNPEKCGALEARARAYSAIDDHSNAKRDIEKALAMEENDPSLHKTSGLIHFEAGDYSRAIRDLNKSFELGLNEPTLYFVMGESYRALNQFEEALESYEKSVGDTDEANLRIAECQYNLGEYSDAYESFKKAEAIAAIPNDLLYAYAHSAFLESQYARVITLLRGVNTKGDPIEVDRMKALSHFELQQYEDALQAAKRSSKDSHINRIGGLAAYHIGQKEEAIKWLEAADPDGEIVAALADASLAINDYDRADKYLSWLIDNGFDKPDYYFQRAELRLKSDVSAALKDLDEALIRDNNLTEARFMKAEIHFDRKDWSKAIPELEILSGNTKRSKEVFYMLGISQLETGNRVEAKSSLTIARESGSQEFRMFAELAKFSFEEENWEEAIKLSTSALQQKTDSELKVLRGQANFKLGQYENAILDLQNEELRLFESHYALGKSYYETDNHQKASVVLGKAVVLRPEEGEVAYLLGNSRFLLENYNGAIESYLKAVANNYKEAVLFNNLGKAYDLLDQREDAISAYTKAIELDPEYSRALQNRGIALFKSGNYEGAIGDLSRIDAAENTKVNFYLAESYYYTDNFKSALIYYNGTIDAGRKDGEVYHQRARTYLALDRIASALSDIDLAIKAGKKDADVYMDRARANIYLGNDRAAMSDLNEAISKDTNNPDAFYNRGYLHELRENFNEAITDYKKVVTLNPNDDKAYYSLANCTVSAGNVGGGLQYIDKAISINDKEPAYFKVKGNILYRIDRKNEACGFWEKAVSMGDNKSSFYIDQYCK